MRSIFSRALDDLHLYHTLLLYQLGNAYDLCRKRHAAQSIIPIGVAAKNMPDEYEDALKEILEDIKTIKTLKKLGVQQQKLWGQHNIG